MRGAGMDWADWNCGRIMVSWAPGDGIWMKLGRLAIAEGVGGRICRGAGGRCAVKRRLNGLSTWNGAAAAGSGQARPGHSA